MSKILITGFLTLQAIAIMVCQSASVVPPQTEKLFASTPYLPNLPTDALTGSVEKYTVTRQTPETITNVPNQVAQAASAIPAPNQHLDTVISLAEKYIPRETTDIQSTVSNNRAQAASTLPEQATNTISEQAGKYQHATRQVAEAQSAASNVTGLPNQINQTASELTNQAGNIDPVAITQCVYRALEENLGRVGSVLFDLMTSREGLGQDFSPIAAYAAQRLGTQNIRNTVNSVVGLASQVDWRSRMQSLFNRIADLRDNRTGLTLQDAVQTMRNIFDDPQALEELRQRIRNDANESVNAAVNVINGGEQQ